MRIDILTLFPEMCEAVMSESIIGRARSAGKVEIVCTNIRDFSGNKWNKVDDTPYGGGMGMLMGPEPIYNCYKAITEGLEYKPFTVYLSPKGDTFCQKTAYEFREKGHIVMLCGHYEGVDQRIIDLIVDREISIGDFVLTGGELAAACVVDSVARLCDGVLSDESCFTEESFSDGLLEYPQYTRPVEFCGMRVPEVLLSGNHGKIKQWRREKALEITVEKRPDLLDKK